MIIKLTEELIAEHAEQYDASMLVAGENVFFDGEMYFTQSQLSEAIWRVEGSLARLGDPLLSLMLEELARLKAALSSFEKPHD